MNMVVGVTHVKILSRKYAYWKTRRIPVANVMHLAPVYQALGDSLLVQSWAYFSLSLAFSRVFVTEL